MEFYELDFYGLKRQLPLSYISKNKKIANFNILGDVEFTEKAGEELEKVLRAKNLIPECFVGPEIKIVPFVHHMAKRFGQKRYVILRKSIRGYMINPTVEHPWHKAPKHAKNLVLNGRDQEFLKGKNVILIDDVVSTGTTMEMLESLMEKIGAKVLAKCCLFKQGEDYRGDLIYLAKLPLIETND